MSSVTISELREQWQEWIGEDEDLDTYQLDMASPPNEWIKFGFTPEEYRQWWDAGAYNAEYARELEDEGFEPKELSRCPSGEELEELGYSSTVAGSSIAYIHCCEQITIEDIHKLLGNDA